MGRGARFSDPSSTEPVWKTMVKAHLPGVAATPGPAVPGLSRQAELRARLVQQPRGRPSALLDGGGTRGPGISLVRIPASWGVVSSAQGSSVRATGTWGRSAGFTRNRQLLGMWVFPVQGLRVFRYHLTNQTQVTPPLHPSNSTPLHFKGLWTCLAEQDHRTKDLMGAGSRLSALLAFTPVCRSPWVDPVLSWHPPRTRGARISGFSWAPSLLGLGCASLSQSLMEGIPVGARIHLFHVRWEGESLTQVAQTKGTEPRAKALPDSTPRLSRTGGCGGFCTPTQLPPPLLLCLQSHQMTVAQNAVLSWGPKTCPQVNSRVKESTDLQAVRGPWTEDRLGG